MKAYFIGGLLFTVMLYFNFTLFLWANDTFGARGAIINRRFMLGHPCLKDGDDNVV